MNVFFVHPFSRRAAASDRRGVLLLVVLSMLTLFLMLGTTYIVIASRARATARSFAKAAADGSSSLSAAHGQRLVDDAFLIVARGPSPGVTGTVSPGEDLLGDKYGVGTTISGTISPNVAGSTVIVCTVSGMSPMPASLGDLAGRVLTFQLPNMGSVSTRILRATAAGSGTQLYLPAGATVGGETLSAARITAAKQAKVGGGPDFIINGREFAGDPSTPALATLKNEPWDGYDAENRFLAKLHRDDTGASPTYKVLASSYTQASPPSTVSPDWVDNDGDGSYDSQWLDLGFPQLYDQNGTAYKAKAAILVVDLDGRVNLNAHGSDADFAGYDSGQRADAYPTIRWSQLVTPQGNVVPAWDVSVPLYTLPRGYGAGPADVSLSRSGIFGAGNTSRFGQVIGGASIFGGRDSSRAVTAGETDSITGRSNPRIGGTVGTEGRAGEAPWNETASYQAGDLTDGTTNLAKPGTTGWNDAIGRMNDLWRTALDPKTYRTVNPFVFGGRAQGPTDLKGRMKIWAADHGQPSYYKPYWSSADRNNVSDDESVDDPYEVNLGRNGPRFGLTHTVAGVAQPADNLFTAAELEGVLRIFDTDQVRLPRRLVSVLGRDAASSRMAVTTESWDTPAVTGKFWSDVIGTGAQGLVANAAAHQYLSPDTIMGLRLDLNQPFHDAPNYTEPNDATGLQRRQLFARQLYCLLVTLFRVHKGGATPGPSATEAEELAQWAVNIVDFRDGDSIMTPFDFDPAFNPQAAAWNPSKRVWGCERPELLLAEGLAWHDRRTEDLASVGGDVVNANKASADDDFDQKRRPRGAFFVELYSPWGSDALRYNPGQGSVGGVGTTTTGNYAGEPLPSELVSSGSAAVRGATIDLGKLAPGRSPVWRLATVRGNVNQGTAFGADPLRPTVTPGSLAILDPSRANSTARIDRTFYFAEPSNTLKNELAKGGVFWNSGIGTAPYDPSQAKPIVVGTPGAAFHATSAPGQNIATVNRPFDAPFPASLTEPTSTDTGQDPYDQIMAEVQPGMTFTAPSAANSYVGSWNSPIDQPLDGLPVPAAVAGKLSDQFVDNNGSPLLMLNGTHDNFAVIHLQRLADPTQAWNATNNPYITVDCLPVDLTVVNTGADGTNYDEPGSTGATPLAYLQQQKQYRNQSVVRGGRVADVPGGQPIKRHGDIWNRSIRPDLANSIDLTDANVFRTAATAARGATGLGGSPLAPQLQATNVPNVSQGFGGIAERNSLNRRFPWLYWANRPFVSANELALVPVAGPFYLTAWHSTAFGDVSNGASPRVFQQRFLHLPGFFDPPPNPLSPWDAITLTGTFSGGGTGVVAGVTKPTILDFVHVPSPFGGLSATVSNPQANTDLATIGRDVKPMDHFSHFRQPGKINVNTIADKRVWRALFGEVNYKGDPVPPSGEFPNSPNEPDFRDKMPNWDDTANPVGWSQDVYGGNPAKSLADFFNRMPDRGSTTAANRTSGGFKDDLNQPPETTEDANHDFFLDPNEDANGNNVLDPGEDLNNNGRLDLGEDANRNGQIDISDRNGNGLLDPGDDYRNTDRHAFFRYETMNRLTNVTTVRSHVFAVWVTIGFFDSTGREVGIDTAESRRYRGFYVFDRSIPVGYETGKDNNVRDAVLLRRILP